MTGILPPAQGQVERNGHISPFLPPLLQPCQFQKLLGFSFVMGQANLPPGLRVTSARKCFGLSVGQVFTSGDCWKGLRLAPTGSSTLGRALRGYSGSGFASQSGCAWSGKWACAAQDKDRAIIKSKAASMTHFRDSRELKNVYKDPNCKF